jgi:hypothetical protein
MSGTGGKSFLDGFGGRLLALTVLVTVGAILLRIHWLDLFPPPEAAVDSDDPVALCFAARASEIDGMLAEGVINEQQAEQFKGRANALCASQQGSPAAPPPLPAN